jgi:Co/Zn/Cd efflux system component
MFGGNADREIHVPCYGSRLPCSSSREIPIQCLEIPGLLASTKLWHSSNFACAMMLARYRTHGGSLTRAAFLSAQNDVLANAAIILAGLVTAYTVSAWPDLVVGLGIFFMNLDAAREVYVAARRERAEAAP